MTQKQVIPFFSGLTEDQTHEWLSHLQKAMADCEVTIAHSYNLHRFQQSDVAIVADPDTELLNSLANLRWVQSLWAGVEGMTTRLAQGVNICRMEDVELQRVMSEAVLAWTLYLHRHMHLYREQQQGRVWLQHPVKSAEHTRVSVLGLGKLGRVACEKLQNNGFLVKGWSRYGKTIEGVNTFHGKNGLKQVLEDTDIVVLLLPLTTETHHLFNSDTFNLIKPGASLINFARGGIIEKRALLSALSNGVLEHAVLDVFDIEPLPDDDPLWQMRNVTILPHISAPTNMLSASAIAATNVQNWLNYGTLPKMVDRMAGY